MIIIITVKGMLIFLFFIRSFKINKNFDGRVLGDR